MPPCCAPPVHIWNSIEGDREPVTLAVEIDGQVVSVDRVDSNRFFRREMALGRIIGDTANAHGKIFAAFKSRPKERRFSRRFILGLTANTITDLTP